MFKKILVLFVALIAMNSTIYAGDNPDGFSKGESNSDMTKVDVSISDRFGFGTLYFDNGYETTFTVNGNRLVLDGITYSKQN